MLVIGKRSRQRYVDVYPPPVRPSDGREESLNKSNMSGNRNWFEAHVHGLCRRFFMYTVTLVRHDLCYLLISIERGSK